MPRSRPSRSAWPRLRCLDATRESGSAAIEFVTAGVLLLVPLGYLVVAVAAIQAGAFAVEGASRQAARVYVQAGSPSQARDQAVTAIDFALTDFGQDPRTAEVTVSCRPRPSDCLARRGLVTVTVAASVPLPLAPVGFGTKPPLAVPLRATTTEQVSRFWGAG